MNHILQETPQPKKKYLLYRILGGINNFIAIFFLFLTFMSFLAMGLQPSLLLYFFVFLSILIYTNLSTVFARHVMIKGNFLRRKLKDWIKVNAIVALLFGGFMVVSIAFVLSNQSFESKVTELYSNMEGVTDQMIQQAIPVAKGILIFFGICMISLIIHVILTFKYIKQFEAHFQDQTNNP